MSDLVYFTDMDGVVTSYEVVALDIRMPMDVEEMISGAYDLILFHLYLRGKKPGL